MFFHLLAALFLYLLGGLLGHMPLEPAPTSPVRGDKEAYLGQLVNKHRDPRRLSVTYKGDSASRRAVIGFIVSSLT